jgi:hypothetical protein
MYDTLSVKANCIRINELAVVTLESCSMLGFLAPAIVDYM